MTREQVYQDIQGTLGIVPTLFKALPEDTLELEWNLFKQVELRDDPIPAKYRELIGLAAASALGDAYCVVAHRGLAQAFGASTAEIEAAVGLAKGVAGWGTYLHGCDMSMETMRREIDQICDFVRSSQMSNVQSASAQSASGQSANRGGNAGRGGNATH